MYLPNFFLLMNYQEFLERVKTDFKFSTNYQHVKQILYDYFGEDKVDIHNEPFSPEYTFHWNNHLLLENYTSSDFETVFNPLYKEDVIESIQESPIIALIYFPFVTVTNEEDQSTIIRDLYVKVKYYIDGKVAGIFTMNRSTYTENELKAGYSHSHLPGIPHPIESFTQPCLGSGPLVSRISNLCRHYSELDWTLFCRELEQYVQTESLEGIPYRRLANINNTGFKPLAKEVYCITNLNFIDPIFKMISLLPKE